MEAYDAGIVHQAPPATMAFWKENDMKRFGVLLASAALGAAVAASGPALAFGGGHGGGFGTRRCAPTQMSFSSPRP
jgi:hypothetical protein